MRRKLTLVLFLFGTTVFGQEFLFDIHNTSLEEYLQMEEKLNSERIPALLPFDSFIGIAPPIQFIREENVIPDLASNYYFRAKDSAMASLIYEWDEKRCFIKAGLRDRNKEEIQSGLRRKFHSLKKHITQIYGEPMAEEGNPGLPKEKQKAGLIKQLDWFPNDSTNIHLSTDFYYYRSLSTTSRFQRIRLYVFNMNTGKEKNRLDTLYNLSKEFMQVLGENDVAGSREYFSDSINENLSNGQIERLINNFNFKPEISLFSGSESKYREEVFSTLKFGHKKDSLTAPEETMIIIFDSRNKIIGIKQAKEKVRKPIKNAGD